MNPKKPQPATAPPHISVHCKVMKGSAAQPKMAGKRTLPAAPRVPSTKALTPPRLVQPRLVQPKLVQPKLVQPRLVQPKFAAVVQPKHLPAPRVPGRPTALVRPLAVGPSRVVQRMILDNTVGEDTPLLLPTPIVRRTASLLSLQRSDGSTIEVTPDNERDQLNAQYTGTEGTFQCRIEYTNRSRGEVLEDDYEATDPFCHQTYIHVPDRIQGKGISYVLAYAGCLYAMDEGYQYVGTNMPNKNSAKLAKGVGFKSNVTQTQVLRASVVRGYAQSRMRSYNWRVVGGTLAPTGCCSCCFLTTACCRWRGLPDDCEELTLLRHYRDTYLRDSETGVSAVEHYYRIAPSIAAAIDQDQNARTIYTGIYEVIERCVAAIKRENYDSVFEQYKQMVLELEDWYSRRPAIATAHQK